MANVAHSSLTGSDLHEPKGVSTATAGQAYIADGAGSGAWTDIVTATTFTTGDLKPTFKITADDGWVMCDDGTIGDVSSAGTTRASNDTEDLFVLLWTNFANAEAAVSGGRGVSAAADFAAHKTIALPKMLGRVYGIAGAGAGLTSRVMGKTTGDETVTLDTTMIPSHTHSVTDPGHTHTVPEGVASGGGTAFLNALSPITTNTSDSSTTGISIQNTGGGAAHANMQPSVFLKMMVKL